MPTDETINNYEAYYYDGTQIEFDEKLAYKQAIKNGVFDIFANSFFVEASCENFETKIDLSKQELEQISDNSKRFYEKDYSKKDYISELQNKQIELDKKEKEFQNYQIELDKKEKEIQSLKSQVDILTNNLKTIEKSKSWKITKPLRAINKVIKK